MLRSLLLVSGLVATFTACSPAEPPLLIDGAQEPATDVAAPPRGPAPTNDGARANSR